MGNWALLYIMLSVIIMAVLSAGVFQVVEYARDTVWPAIQKIRANQRAKSLLKQMLTTSEYHQILKYGYLDIFSPTELSRIYRVPFHGGLVKVFDSGRPIMELCVQSIEQIPHADVVLMHKLMIEACEDEYLRIAKHFAPGVISPHYFNAQAR